MNNRLKISLSLVLALIAAILTYSFLSSSKDEVNIVVAATDIEKGMIIKDNIVEIKAVPRKVKEEYFKDAVSKREDVIGCVTKQKINKDQPILMNTEVLSFGEELINSLTEDGRVNDPFFIPEDKRLITIEVDNSGSINYSVKKGDFVDVIYSSVDESTGGLYSSMLLQHIEIYDVEKITSDKGGIIAKKQNVILLATPEECLTLVAGNRNGILDLALNPLKGSTENINPISILRFSASKPVTKNQKLDNLQGYIKNLEMTEEVKDKILSAIDEERDIDALKEFVNSTSIDSNTKESILELLNQER